MSKGFLLKKQIQKDSPLQVIGVINAYTAIMAKEVGFSALYLSGAGVANSSWGLPDIGMTHLNDVLEDARRILSATDLPLIVDIDTGWGSLFNIQRAVRSLDSAGVACVHIEDQVSAKRCGHRPNKSIVSLSEMSDRLKAALDARIDPNFMIMARTDALATEGFDKTLERIITFQELGADAIFAEAVDDFSLYQKITQAVDIPVLANLTEFGKTTLKSREAFRDTGIQMLLYPLSVFRSMNFAALNTLKAIKETGSQQSVLATMQTREELYEFLNYHHYETILDEFNSDQNRSK